MFLEVYFEGLAMDRKARTASKRMRLGRVFLAAEFLVCLWSSIILQTTILGYLNTYLGTL